MVAINNNVSRPTFDLTSELRQSRSPDQSQALFEQIAQRRPPRGTQKAPEPKSQQACPPEEHLSFPEVRRERDRLIDLDKRLSENKPPRSQKELDDLADQLSCMSGSISNAQAQVSRLMGLYGSDPDRLQELEKVRNDLVKLESNMFRTSRLGRLVELRQPPGPPQGLPKTLDEAKEMADALRRRSDDVDIAFDKYERKPTHSQKDLNELARLARRLDGISKVQQSVEKLMERFPDDRAELEKVNEDLRHLFGSSIARMDRLGRLQLELREETRSRGQSATPPRR